MDISRDDFVELRDDVKDIKSMLIVQLVVSTKLEAEVSLHRKLWGGLVGIVVTVGVFFIQKYINRG